MTNDANVAKDADPHCMLSSTAARSRDAPQNPTTRTNSVTEELPDYMKTICVKHSSLWLKDVERATSRLTKIHAKRMNEFASEVFAAFKNNAMCAHELSSPPSASTPITSPLRASTHIFSSPRDEEAVDNSDPSCSKQTPSPEFCEETARTADEVEQSAGKTANRKDPSSSISARSEDHDIIETARPLLTGADIECPTFNLLPAGVTWTQHLADSHKPSPRAAVNMSNSAGEPPESTSGTADLEKHTKVVDKTTGAEQEIDLPTAGDNAPFQEPFPDGCHSSSSVATVPKQAPIPDGGQSSYSVDCTIGTQTQVKNNRKKRAFLGLNNNGANQKKLKKLKVTDKSKELYGSYILRKCIRPPVDGEERPHFVDFGNYHISYEHFREALKPRGRIDNHVMELFIRHFNLVTNTPTTSEPMCTKFAFSQSLTAKLIVDHDKFDPKSCLKEFQEAYKDHQLKSKDMLYFAIVCNEHWVLVSINLLHKQVNVLDSMRSAKKTKVYERVHFLVNNFITLASFAKAFPKTNFGQFVQNNPEELRQQTTLFDCGVFVMLFMKLWDGKIMKPFSQNMIDHRMEITLMIMTSELNKADPTWVLQKK